MACTLRLKLSRGRSIQLVAVKRQKKRLQRDRDAPTHEKGSVSEGLNRGNNEQRM